MFGGFFLGGWVKDNEKETPAIFRGFLCRWLKEQRTPTSFRAKKKRRFALRPKSLLPLARQQHRLRRPQRRRARSAEGARGEQRRQRLALGERHVQEPRRPTSRRPKRDLRWMDEIQKSHHLRNHGQRWFVGISLGILHFESMGDHCLLVFSANRIIPGFLNGGAGVRPSTVGPRGAATTLRRKWWRDPSPATTPPLQRPLHYFWWVQGKTDLISTKKLKSKDPTQEQSSRIQGKDPWPNKEALRN